MEALPGAGGAAGGPGPLLVAEVLDAVVAADPDREAVVTRSGRWSYAELDRMAAAAAGALAELGVGPGDRVAGALPNEIDAVVAFHGAMRLGALWVGVNRALAAPEKAYVLSDSGARLLLCDGPTAEQLADPVLTLPGLRRVVVGDRGAAGADPPGEWHEALAAAPFRGAAGAPRPALDPDAAAALAYTSGTTGYPKGAVHSQRNLLLPGAVLTAARGYGPELRKGDCLPLTILNMLVLTTLLVAQAGGCTVIMDRIDARGVAEWIERERVTTWNGPPALLYSMVHDDAVVPGALASLEEVWVGGADCPESLRRDFAAKFGLPVTGTYGLTEAPTVVAIDPRIPGADGHRPGASGRPLPHLDVTVRADDGAVLAPGETGEVCLAAVAEGAWADAYRPPLGYWERPDASAELLRDGVVHTGDLGFLDGDGYLHVRDRRNQTIIRGGANVYPAEVERVLSAVPGVAACAVFGIPDERLGQRVVAAVERQPGAALTAGELTERCAAELARYKVPERFAFVEGFARNSMGKIDRRQLGALFPPEPLP